MVKLPLVVSDPEFTTLVFAMIPWLDSVELYSARDASLRRQTLPAEQVPPDT